MATQQPVIPPVAMEEFTCAGNGLLYEEHPRESPANLRSLLLPTGDKNGIGDRDRPKTWWLAQNKFYGLAKAKATPINILRSKLEDALRTPNGMKIPERILNLEAEGNRKYRELSELVLQETKPSKKTTNKASKGVNQTYASAAGSKTTALSSKGKVPAKPAPARNVGGAISSGKGTKQTARKGIGSRATPKRARSPGDSSEVVLNKRRGVEDEGSPFGDLTGTYELSVPRIREEWDSIEDEFKLVITLTSEKRLYGAFHLGICSGALLSTVDIEPRVDGASAEFEWCGQEENGEYTFFPPEDDMIGVLRFTRREQDRRHTIKGVIESISAVGRCEFTGEKISDAIAIEKDWDDYRYEMYQDMTPGRWIMTKERFQAQGEEWDSMEE